MFSLGVAILRIMFVRVREPMLQLATANELLFCECDNVTYFIGLFLYSSLFVICSRKSNSSVAQKPMKRSICQRYAKVALACNESKGLVASVLHYFLTHFPS